MKFSFLMVLLVAYFIAEWQIRKNNQVRTSRLPPPEGTQFIRLSQGRVRYQLSKKNDGVSPLVVMVHGLAGPMDVLREFAKFTAKNTRFRTLIFDLYGRGWSDGPATTYNP